MNCDLPTDQLINLSSALDFMLQHTVKTQQTTIIKLNSALNKILAADVIADINVPNFDNSAMDGYVITSDSYKFEVVERIVAGDNIKSLISGTAARIFTGAPIPDHTFAVVKQEECKVIDNEITIERKIIAGENIRRKGNDIKSGAVVLTTGTKLNSYDIAIAASIGMVELIVFKPIVVGVFFTGDELIKPGQKLAIGKIYNSNSYAIVALLNSLGCEVINLGNIKDSLDATCEALTKLQRDCDLIITTGGASVGEEDYIKPALVKLGELLMWKIKIKPGKPLAFGKINSSSSSTPFIGLPGNPVSAMVTFLLFVCPFIKTMQGRNKINPQIIKAQLGFNWQSAKPRREFVRVKLDYSTMPPTAICYPKQSSEVLSSMVWGDGLLEIPEQSIFKQGQVLNFHSFAELIS